MSTTVASTDPAAELSGERRDLLQALGKHRELFLVTAEGLTDDQARTRSTASELTVGGLINHVASTEEMWAQFAVHGPEAFGPPIDWSNPDPAMFEARVNEFLLPAEQTLAEAVANYRAVAARTDELVRTLDLDAGHPLPEAPWFEAGASWSARRVFVHIVAETAQHAGHADIIRESIDGHKSMG